MCKYNYENKVDGQLLNYSTNINRMNDIQPEAIEHKSPRNMSLKTQVLDWDRHKIWRGYTG